MIARLLSPVHLIVLICLTCFGLGLDSQPPTDYEAAKTLQAQLQANNEPQPVLDAAAALVKLLAPPPARLMTAADLTWVRSFRIPVWYGGNNIGLGPTGQTLYVGGTNAGTGHDHPLLAEVSIPAVNGAMVSIVQPMADATGGLDAQANRSGVWLGGTCIYNGGLLWTAYPNYNVTSNVTVAMGQSSLNLSAPNAKGMYGLSATVDGKAVQTPAMAGWVTAVPAAWSTLFPGATHFCGLGGINAIYTVSSGPAAFGFDASKLATTAPTPATPYVYYPIDHPMPGFNPTPKVWTGAVRGMFCVQNSKVYGMGWVGSLGIGQQWYGLARTDPNDPNNPRNPPPGLSGTDPCSSSEGNHSQGKMPTVWIADPKDVVAAPKPYSLTIASTAMGGTNAPTPSLASACATFDGCCQDVPGFLLYVLQSYGGVNGQSWVHVYQIAH
jgi:hypothetical protein